MALISFFGSRSKELFSGRKRGYYIQTDSEFIGFDLLTDESHTMPLDVTAYNIEDGSNVTENIRLPLRTGNIIAFISNFSINDPSGKTIIDRLEQRLEPKKNKAQEAYDALVRIRDERKPVKIITNLEIYEKVLLTGIDVSRDSNSGESQYFSINFCEARIVKLKSVAVDVSVRLKNMKNNKNRQAAAKVDVGRR